MNGKASPLQRSSSQSSRLPDSKGFFKPQGFDDFAGSGGKSRDVAPSGSTPSSSSALSSSATAALSTPSRSTHRDHPPPPSSSSKKRKQSSLNPTPVKLDTATVASSREPDDDMILGQGARAKKKAKKNPKGKKSTGGSEGQASGISAANDGGDDGDDHFDRLLKEVEQEMGTA